MLFSLRRGVRLQGTPCSVWLPICRRALPAWTTHFRGRSVYSGYDAVDSQEYELFKMDSERLLTKESLLELLQEFNEQTASLATVLMEMGKLV